MRLQALRSDFDPRVRPLKPTVGGGQISGAYRRRTGGAGSYARSSVFLKEKTHLRLLPGATFGRCLVQPVPNGTMRTCWACGTMSALEGRTDLRWKRRYFRF